MTQETTDHILTRLMALHPKIIDLSLDRMWQILEKLDHPEQRLPPVIHVAGTNGKGSLLAYLRAMLEAAGYRVHVYVSPHLVRFNERIRLAGSLIDEDALAELLSFCERANGSSPITYFEVTTAAALKAFADSPADILLLETGLGGRLDATNVIEKPALTAITPISQDHAQYLGTDIAGIAGEKAGILKSNVAAVFGPQERLVSDVLTARATTVGAKPYIYGSDWFFSEVEDGWCFSSQLGKRKFTFPSLQGTHQVANAATAVACLEQLSGFRVSDRDIDKGLINVRWPGRLQRLFKGPLVNDLPPHVEIWLDGGHNPAAAVQMANTFAKWNVTDPKPSYLIAGMLNTKDQTTFFSRLRETVSKGCCIAIEGESATTPASDLAAMAQSGGISMTAKDSLEDSLLYLQPELDAGPCRLLITGSLYLAGQILKENE
ncbi:bifunctional folylpolyglutamate synthase/dihydrofolate synthase [Sneathiella marina]|uniref:Bifunctional folylpolyglutamate synthase/dihydrofolate synthase n=1 Tax=Sneathiella marina TaxID=2950108 RepID=A0ABY4W3P4_9PROT|nr:folylpolyglutamate synthase/dihydrofolate synthase family protein [Sneathiella marina]USG61441.1 bifunctional folylpolyglutamate synthase/dihydrofolate synthase [Sneathiella marina]